MKELGELALKLLSIISIGAVVGTWIIGLIFGPQSLGWGIAAGLFGVLLYIGYMIFNTFSKPWFNK